MSKQSSLKSEKTLTSQLGYRISNWLWRRKTPTTASGIPEKEVDVRDDTPGTPSISFFQLFKYSTPFELLLNVIGVIAAAAAGSAQPLMSIVFGRLTQDFVNFTRASKMQPPDERMIQEAAADFRRTAAVNATYLVYIGKSMNRMLPI
ncbi:hypothetical protein HGRIS_004145 [Hohenbuehelia grisea]|uniref:ABC transmembrane type-1 domain-containing protein n=1 Tax=Hohenbuehelia grisea TaxID=104357 RepID=A0ABR3JHL6_9AGAR